MGIKLETWRYHANRWQTWLALSLLAVWIAMYALASLREPALTNSSTYWPTYVTGIAVPYQGGIYRAKLPPQNQAIPREQLVLLGQHDGVPFYGILGAPLGGGGGLGRPVLPRLFVAAGDGTYVELQRVAADPNLGRFMR